MNIPASVLTLESHSSFPESRASLFLCIPVTLLIFYEFGGFGESFLHEIPSYTHLNILHATRG
jgi:hypothetical protein